MTSPFPGMDPYLEDPRRWVGLQKSLVVAIAGILNAALPQKYVADIGERTYLAVPGKSAYPFLEFEDRDAPTPAGDVPLSPRSAPTWRFRLMSEEVHEPFVKVLALGEHERVVTVVEVLSLLAKTPGEPARELYLDSQRSTLDSEIHLMDVDLLRTGEHTVAAPLRALTARGERDYLACLRRAGRAQRYEIWPFRLRDRLPWIRIPLSEGGPDIEVDLQAVFERAYEEGAYSRLVDYQRAPAVPLGSDDAAWADALLREKGLRS